MKCDELILSNIIRDRESNKEEMKLGEIQYLSAQDMSNVWGITKRRVQNLCVTNRIPGVIRIGNMWAIPSDASKPKDARIKEHAEIVLPTGITLRKARKKLKALVDDAIKELRAEGVLEIDATKTLVVVFSAKLLHTYIDDYDACIEKCQQFFEHVIETPVSDGIHVRIESFIEEHEICLDDALSWVYQFSTKKSDIFPLSDTQFFTEKYMINTLVDSLKLDGDDVILDPACGGGNFLLYSFDVLMNRTDATKIIERVKHVLNNLCGYEIDRFLAFVATFNLKLKAMSYIKREQLVSLKIFDHIQPSVLYPYNNDLSGYLDKGYDDQFVISCGSGIKQNLKDALKRINVIVTNPPFRTIKGMPEEQKTFLQEHYPNAKCDMCNAFIERVMETLPVNGKAAMVTQNSWMYLDSFTKLRTTLLKKYSFNDIWELGSNAFYDLSGEKANVALVSISKQPPKDNHKIGLSLLRNMDIEQIENLLEQSESHPLYIKQNAILDNVESRFDMVSTEHLKSLQMVCEQYKEYAVPMQGTSTGDAKNLIDYYWKHMGDTEWVLVSKGGGYSRFEGLNSYCVKWGKDGEYIKRTKGSAIRNANYFDQTQLVFSDTGTAGLNVRVLMPGQIFVASGPGIRIKKGRKLSHLAFLNSRFAAFFVRLTSPKLTIAAGYIGQIPVKESILCSKELEKSAERCLKSKGHRLSKRPNNVEFKYIKHRDGVSIADMAREWFGEDIKDEWTQLVNEQKIEDLIEKEMELSTADKAAIDNYIGERKVLSVKNQEEDIQITKSDIDGVLGSDCFPKRTKANKKSLGADGLIEYLSQLKRVSCESVYTVLSRNADWFDAHYRDLYIHALVLSSMRFREGIEKVYTIQDIITTIGKLNDDDLLYVENWIKTRFNVIHNEAFENRPFLKYDHSQKAFLLEE